MSNSKDMNALADRIMRAIEQSDVETVTICYGPDARIWHNFDGKEQSVEENLRTIRWIDKRLKNRKYQIVSRYAFDGGYVQQHVLTGTLNNGQAFSMPACLIVTVRDGRIARLEEYLDSAHIQPLRIA
jgi:ketosteroid isomerase-like protein